LSDAIATLDPKNILKFLRTTLATNFIIGRSDQANSQQFVGQFAL